jgi:hypothetical protein
MPRTRQASACSFLRAHYVEPKPVSRIEILKAHCASLRAHAIALGQDVECAKIEGKTIRIIRWLETAHRSAWQRYYAVDCRLHGLIGEQATCG